MQREIKKCRQIYSVIAVIIALVLGSLCYNIRPAESKSATWIVDDDGPADFHTIQEAINASSSGDIIYVKAGKYYEHIAINKTLSLVGENKYSTIIDANLTSISVVILTLANHVSIRGFTLMNSQPIHCLVGGGVHLVGSNGARISDNIIRNNQKGINLEYSINNIIIGNDVIENDVGIQFLENSGNCTIYHNNFNSSIQIREIENATNIWDNGFEGNYWSDYDGVDSDSDGIGDKPYNITGNEQDKYPFMNWINTFDAGTWDGTTYYVNIVCNSIISEFYFDSNDYPPFLRFKVNGSEGSMGVCRVTFPKDLLWAESGWGILVDDESIANFTEISNTNYTCIYFTYNHSTRVIRIIGSHAIPEFPSWVVLPLFMILTLTTVIVHKRKQHPH